MGALTAAAAIQLRIFEVIPSGFLAHAETSNQTLPLVQPGEVVVVDPYEPDVAEGELFVVEYGRGTGRPSRLIIEPRRCAEIAGGLDADCWWLGAYARPRTNERFMSQLRAGGFAGFSDGPWERHHVNEKLIGRVVGIYRPAAGRIG